MRALVLFCGTGSVDRAFERLGWEVISVDILAKFKPTHVANIIDWDYPQYPRDYFDFCWGSPPCTHFSIARTTGGPRDIQGATALVQRTLEIFQYFCCPWAIENPATGLLKIQDVVQGLPFVDTTYCKYDEFPYKKYKNLAHIRGRVQTPTCLLQNKSLRTSCSRWFASNVCATWRKQS